MITLFFTVNSYSQISATDIPQYQQGLDLYDSGQTSKARTVFKSLEEEYCPVGEGQQMNICVETKFNLINVASRLGESDESKMYIDEVLNYLDQHSFKGESYYKARVERVRMLSSLGQNNLESAEELASGLHEFIEEEQSLSALAVFHSTLGFYEDAMGNYDKAIHHYTTGIESAINVNSLDKVGSVLLGLHNNLGVSYKNIGMLDEARVEYEKSLDLIHSMYDFETNHEATAYINLGGIYYSLSDIGLASEYFKRAVEIYRSLTGDFSGALGASLNNLAATQYMLGNYILSARYFEEAQRIKEENLGLDHPDTAVGYSNLAALYILNRNFEEAQTNYERSISVRENVYGTDHPNLIEPNISLGNLHSQHLKQHGLAREYYETALSIALDRLGSEHPDVTDIYLQIGNSYMGSEMYSESEDYINRALENLYGSFDLDHPIDFDRSLSDPVALVKALSAMSELLRVRNDSFVIKDFENSLMALRWAADLVDVIQRTFKNEASKLQLIEKNYSIYTDAVETLSTLHEETGDEKYMDQIFETIEKSRSRVTLELIQKVNASKFAGVPTEIIRQEKVLNSKITDMQQELHNEESRGLNQDSLRVNSLRELIFQYKRELDDFTDKLEENYPSYYHLKYDQSIISRADAQSLLKSDEVVLSYILGSERAYVMVLTKEDMTLVDLEEPSGIEDIVIEMKEYVLTENLDEYRQRAHKLYELLIQPAEPYITGNKLIIMADQSLHYLPFELLLTEVPDHNRYSSYPYLVHEYVFSYIPSLTLLEEMNSRKEDDPRNLLALAPFSSEISSEDKLLMDHQYSDRANPLYLTQYETASISSHFRNRGSLSEYFNPQKTELLMGNDATVSRFSEADLSDYDYIHFATHAFINEQNPEFSAILLYPEEGNSGATYVGDIYSLELDANLVVLGACQTGMGSVYKGEGIIGFTRAFIYAGASNLAVSMWRVSDQPTAYLMIDFYEFIRKGHDYSDALRLAKLNMISNPQFANPVNWAAFTLTGR